MAFGKKKHRLGQLASEGGLELSLDRVSHEIIKTEFRDGNLTVEIRVMRTPMGIVLKGMPMGMLTFCLVGNTKGTDGSPPMSIERIDIRPLDKQETL